MEWYSKYTDHLLRDDKIRINENNPLKGIRDDIAGSITSLYQTLLYYQIRSVCFYFKKTPIFSIAAWISGPGKLEQ